MLITGAKVRYTDVEKLERYKKVNILEFHLSDSDLNIPINKNYKIPVVFHSPEYIKTESGFRQLINPATNDEYLRILSRDLIRKTINYVENNKHYFLGAAKIIMHPGGMSEDRNIINTKPLLKNLSRFLKIIDYKNNVFLLENMPPYPWYYGGTWISNIFVDDDEIVNFCEENNINICLDISHAGLACKYLNKDINKYISNLLPYTNHIHIADSSGNTGEGIQIDSGDIDFKEIFKLLNEESKKRNIYIIPEIWYMHYDNYKGLKIALEKVEDYINEVNIAKY